MSIPTDTNFVNQWYLRNTTAGEYDLNVAAVWADYTGAGIKVYVFDNGFDYTNSDLAPNYDTSGDHDFGQGDDDAAPVTADDNHGTAVMGIIGAARNGTGVVGIAYDASLTGFRLDFNVSADVWRAEMVSGLALAVSGGGEVFNMSFGGAGDFDTYDGAANVVLQKQAIADALANGRDGLGMILVKSAGNSRGDDIDVNHNSMDGDSRQIIVAAVDRSGFVSNYSSYGAPILVSAFGSPYNGQIVTTDRTGTAGYSDTDITTSFNGTSAAAPMISGVVALILQANDDLGWRDVQSILSSSARHVGSAINGESLSGGELHPWRWNAATNWNGGGMHFSEDYGYGLVDALAAVRLAETWTAQSTSANEQTVTSGTLSLPTPVPDGGATGSTVTTTLSGDLVVERVTVDIDMSTTATGDMKVYLTGPDGTEVLLMGGQGDLTDFTGTIDLNSQAFRGVSSAGNWSVRIADTFAADPLTVTGVTITAYGSTPGKADTYVYTNEFSDFAGIAGHSKTLKDTDGGIDTLNASAVTSAITVDLGAGTGKIDGVAVKISGIENVDGGDGRDHLTGSKAANELFGGRGGDVLAGAGGADTFLYHMVRDSLFGSNHDLISDFSSIDLIDLSGIDTGAADGDQAFRFIGTKAFTGVIGQLDFEQVDKKGSAHDFTFIYADLDGNKSADFEIALKGLYALGKDDFVL
jgi:subtilisin family serine protease